MRERIRLVIAALLYYSGLVQLALWWQQRISGSRVIILNYHRAIGKNLRSQMRYLSRHYRVMHVEEALDELYTPCDQKRRSQDRRIPIALTFDDAYLDNYRAGLQLVRELQVPITIYVIPGYTEKGTCFWWLAGEYLVEQTQAERVIIRGHTYHLAQEADRKELARVIDEQARNACSVTAREAFLSEVQQALGVSLPHRTESEQDDLALPMTWKELAEMEGCGLVSLGVHTMNHPLLACLTDEEELRYEIAAGRQEMEKQLGHEFHSFAYPIGKMRHIGERAVHIVKDAGYAYALTTIEDVNTAQTDPYLLGRLPGDVELHWLVMASELAGLLGIMSRLKAIFRSGLDGLRHRRQNLETPGEKRLSHHENTKERERVLLP